MDSQISEQEKYISTREAAFLFGYTNDYVSKLAREGKVSAKKIGKAWFVEEGSLKVFVAGTRQAEEGRLLKLKEERTVEYKKKNNGHSISTPPVPRVIVSPVKKTNLFRTGAAVAALGLFVFASTFVVGFEVHRLSEDLFSSSKLRLVKSSPVISKEIMRNENNFSFPTVTASSLARTITERVNETTRALLIPVPENIETVYDTVSPKTVLTLRDFHDAFLDAPIDLYFFSARVVDGYVNGIFSLSRELTETFLKTKALTSSTRAFHGRFVDHVTSLWLDRSLVGKELKADIANAPSALFYKTVSVLPDVENVHSSFTISSSLRRVNEFTSTIVNVPRALSTAVATVSDSIGRASSTLASVVGAFAFSPYEIKTTTVEYRSSLTWFEQLQQGFRSLFGQTAPVAVPESNEVVVEKVDTPVVVERVADRTPTTVVNNITESVTVAGISPTDLTRRLQELENALRSEIYLYSARAERGVSGNYRAIQLMNVINNLDGVTITNATISGGSISGVSGLGATSLDGLSDVTVASPANGQVLLYDGSVWNNVATSSLGITGSGSSFGQAFELTGGALAPTSTVGVIISASSTITNLSVTNGTTTSATSTSLFASNLTVGSLSGLLKATSGVVSAAVAGVDYVTNAFREWTLSTNTFGQSALAPTTTQNIAVSGIGTSTFAGGLEAWRQVGAPYFNATSTTATSTFAGGLEISGQASTSALVVSNSFRLQNLTGLLRATAGVIATATIDLANDVGSSILAVANGGTGWANLQANTLLLGNGTGRVATTSAGTNGQILSLVAGIPSWVATTTFSTGLTYSAGNVTADLGTSIAAAEIADGDHGDFTYVSGSATIDADAIALATDTTGNYVATLADSGVGTLTISGSGSENAAVTAALNLANANSWTALQQFTRASSTQLSAYTASFGATATSTFSSTGALTLNTSGTGSLSVGNAGVVLTDDGDGALTILGAGNGNDESLTINFDDGGNPNVVLISSSSGVSTTSFSGIALNATYLNITGTAATSTFSRGIDLAGGCFSINNVCLSLPTISGVLDLVSQVGASILAVANGGTGWANLQANTLLLGNGTGKVATTSAGTNGQILSLVAGVPSWVATTTFSSGLTYSGGNVTADLGTSIDLASAEVTGVLPVANGGTNNSSAYTAGSVVFSSGTALTQDNTNLFWDDTNNRLGVGTSTPQFILSLSALSQSGIFTKSETGNVFNTIDRGDAADRAEYRLATDYIDKWMIGLSDSDTAGFDGTEFFIGQTSGGSGANVVVETNGNVGVGTTSPLSKLHVSSGFVRAPNANSDILIEDSTGDAVLNILTTATNNSAIYLGDENSAQVGRIDYDHVDNSLRLWANNAEALTILSTGFVGVGSTTPNGKLTVTPGATGAQSLFGYSINQPAFFAEITSARPAFLAQVANASFGANDNGAFQFIYPFDTGASTGKVLRASKGTTLADFFWVDVAGSAYFASNVGVGTTTPWKTLSVVGTASINGLTSSATGDVLCLSSTNEITRDTTPGAGVCGNSASDERLKTNIQPLTNVLDRFNQLEPVTFEWINPTLHEATTSSGFVAQDIEKIFPELVGENPCVGADCTLTDETGMVKTISLSDPRFYGYIVQAVRELYALVLKTIDRVTGAEARINDLERRLAALEAATQNSSMYPATTEESSNSIESEASFDSETPVIIISGNNPAEISVGDSYTDLGATVSDNVDQNLGIHTFLNGVEVVTVNIDTTIPGDHEITYRATDNAGNVGEAIRTVMVNNLTPPATSADLSVEGDVENLEVLVP